MTPVEIVLALGLPADGRGVAVAVAGAAGSLGARGYLASTTASVRPRNVALRLPERNGSRSIATRA